MDHATSSSPYSGPVGPAPVDVDVLRRLALDEGLSIRRIAARLDRSFEAVARLLERTGIAAERRRRADAMAAARVARNAAIVGCCREGLDITAVAARFGVGPSLVSRAVADAEAREEMEERLLRLADTSAAFAERGDRRGALVPTRVIGAGFGRSPDVEPADAALAAGDAAPFRGGRYPKSPRPRPLSVTGSPGLMCAEG